MCDPPQKEWVPTPDYVANYIALRENTERLCAPQVPYSETQRAAMAFVRQNRPGIELLAAESCVHGLVAYLPRGPLSSASLASSTAESSPWCSLEAPDHPYPPVLQLEKTVLLLDWSAFINSCINATPSARFGADDTHPNHFICNVCECRLYPERFVLLETAASAAIWDRAAAAHGMDLPPPVLLDDLCRRTQRKERNDALLCTGESSSPHKRRRYHQIYLTSQISTTPDAVNLVRDSLVDFAPRPVPFDAPFTARELVQLAFHPRFELAAPHLLPSLRWLAPEAAQPACWPLSFLKHAGDADVYFTGGALAVRLASPEARLTLKGRCRLLVGPCAIQLTHVLRSGSARTECYTCDPPATHRSEGDDGTHLRLLAPRTTLCILVDDLQSVVCTQPHISEVDVAVRMRPETEARVEGVQERAMRTYTSSAIRRCHTKRATRPKINPLVSEQLQGAQRWRALARNIRANMQSLDAFLAAARSTDVPVAVHQAYSALCRITDTHHDLFEMFARQRTDFGLRVDVHRSWIYLCRGVHDAPFFGVSMQDDRLTMVALPSPSDLLACSDDRSSTKFSLEYCLRDQFAANEPSSAPLDVAFGRLLDPGELPSGPAATWSCLQRMCGEISLAKDALMNHKYIRMPSSHPPNSPLIFEPYDMLSLSPSPYRSIEFDVSDALLPWDRGERTCHGMDAY